MIALLAVLASAPPSPVAVIPQIVEAADRGGISRAAVLDAVRAVASERVSVRVISDEELFVAGSGLDQELANCGTDTACIATRLRATRARLALVVAVNELVRPPLVSVELLDVDVVRSAGRDASRVRTEERDAPGAIRARTAALLDGAGHPPSSRLAIAVEPEDAEVRIEGEVQAPEAIGDLVVAPGLKRIQVRHDGYHPYDEELVCAPGALQSVDVVLDVDADPLASPWLWIGAGAVVVAGVVVAVVALQPGPPCICAGPPGVPCPDC